MNAAAADDVADKLMHLSIETGELIENCEKASEETRFFESKSEILEEQVRRVNNENEALRRENENLRGRLNNATHVGELWIPVVKNANLVLNSIAPNIDETLEKLRSSENARVQLERELVALKEENSHLRVEIEEKNLFANKQSADFLSIKSTVDDYQMQVSRLDAELKDCHSRVSALNENLEIINAENLDLAEYTSFKSLLKRLGSQEDVSQIVFKLQTLYEIDELFDKKFSPHLDDLGADDKSDVSAFASDDDSNVVNRVKNYLVKALYIIEKLNENKVRSSAEFESVIKCKNDEIAKLKELSYHVGLYNEILEKTLKQCRDNAKMDKYVEERTDRLMAANKALHDNFQQLRQVCAYSYRYNDELFAKLSQLHLWLRIFKIRFDKLTPSPPNDTRNFFALIGELFDQVAEKRADLDGRIRDSNAAFANYESSLVVDDNLQNTVNSMTQEVERLTYQVEQQMNERMREIESLKGEMDSIKTDNCQLANKIKNCNREIISLSTENYDLNEKLSIFSRIEGDCEALKNQLRSARSELGRYENWRSVVAELSRSCCELKLQNVRFKDDVSFYTSTCDALLQKAVQLARKSNESLADGRCSNERKCQASHLTALRAKCRQFKLENQNLKVSVQNISRQMCEEISSLKSNLHDTLVSPTAVNEARSHHVHNLLQRCRDLKKQNQLIKEAVFSSCLDETIETARRTLSTKLECVARDLEHLQSDLNTTIDAKHQSTELVHSHLQDISKIAVGLKSSLESLSSSIESLTRDFVQFVSALQRNIQEAITRTFEHMQSSAAVNNEEIIKEMQEINSELKNRSETIFMLNQRVDELAKEKQRLSQLSEEQEKLVRDLNDQLCSQRDVITQKESVINSIKDDLQKLTVRSDDEIKKKNAELSSVTKLLEKTEAILRSKEDTICALENELSKAKDNQVADGDVSSMGNISRTEEISRLRDVEDSFEERYMKLRCIAVKMKKTIADLNQQLKNEKSEYNAVQCKLAIATEQAKRNQALQEECDRITDELELKTNEIKELKKIIVEADRKNEKYESLMKQYHDAATQKHELELEKNNLTSLLEQLKVEKFAEETLKKEFEKETQRLKQKVKEYGDSLKKIQNDLEQANVEARKRGTFTLEVRDYEKTISNLTEKLKTKSTQVDELNEKMKISAESNATLAERIRVLEEQITLFGTSSKIADEQTLDLNKTVTKLEKDLEINDATLKKLKQDVQVERSQNERLKLQLAESIAEVGSFREQLKNEQESSNNRLKLAQNRVKTLEEQLTKKINEFDQLKADFETYKIRAHNVLQKHKNENNLKNNEEKLTIKIDDLSQTVKELRKRLDEALVESDNHKVELKLLEASKGKLQLRLKEIQEACAEKTSELDAVNVEYKSYKLNNETLMKCYENEIEDLRATCQKLNTQLEDSKSSRPREITSKQNDGAINHGEKNERVSVGRPHSEDNVTLPVIHEKNPLAAKSQNHELISLEKLLKTDSIEEKQYDDASVAELRKNIDMLESQVAYLNEILNESEKNAARSEQHVAWLKDVNKRLQKTIDRAPHLQNGEYLKNVLFNFFTFPDGEEKCKLITILETLLQLTPEEKGILSAIAKGDRSEQKLSSGFTSFFKLG